MHVKLINAHTHTHTHTYKENPNIIQTLSHGITQFKNDLTQMSKSLMKLSANNIQANKSMYNAFITIN